MSLGNAKQEEWKGNKGKGRGGADHRAAAPRGHLKPPHSLEVCITLCKGHPCMLHGASIGLENRRECYLGGGVTPAAVCKKKVEPYMSCYPGEG